jgi:hypothetical protein
MAVGCSAETGDQGPEAQIGSTAEALSTSAGNAFPAAIKSMATCTVKDTNNVEYMLTVGGFATASASPVADIYITSNGTWAHAKSPAAGNPDVNLATARGQALAIQDPNNAARCIVVGGSSTFNGKALSASGNHLVDVLEVDTNGHITVKHDTNGDDTGTEYAEIARTRGKLQACSGTSKVVYFGGLDDSGTTGTAQATIAIFDTSALTTAWDTSNAMKVARVDFGLAQESGQGFVAAAGITSGGSLDNTLELLKTSTCAANAWTIPASATTFPNGTTPPGLTNFPGRSGNAVIFRGAGTFSVSAGKIGTNASRGDSLDLSVSWTTPSVTMSNGTALANSVVTNLPNVVQSGSTAYLLGGLSSTTATFKTNAVQKSYWSSVDLAAADGRVYGGAELLGSTIYFVGGSKLVSGTETLLSTTDAISVP